MTAKGRHLLAGSCLVALAALSQPALAQTGATPQTGADQSDNGGIQDIVVTARYVAENVQDTPIAITAQTDKQLEAANVTNIGTLGAVVPNLFTMPGDSQSAGTPRISLRGVSQGASSSLAVPPALAIYTDDVYHSTTAGSDLDFTDVSRVEVNRGPQSTLSGNASIGGSIKLFTQDPKGDGSGFISLGYGSRNHMEASGAFDLGISDTLAIRALGHFDRQRGFGNRLDFPCMMDKLGTPALKGTLSYFQPDSAKKDCVIGHTGGGTTAVGQVKLLWKPIEGISLLLTARHREEDLEETPEVTLGFQKVCTQPVTGFPTGIGPQPCPQTGAGSVGGATQIYQWAAYKAFGVLFDNRFVTPLRNGGTYDTYATNCRPIIDTTLSLPNANPAAAPTTFPAGYPVGLCYEPRKFAKHTQLSAKLEAEITDDVNLTAILGHTDYSNEFTQNGDQTPLGAVITHFINLDKMTSGEVRFDGKLFDNKLQWVLGGFAVRTDGYQNNMVSFVNTFQLSSVHGDNESKSVFAHLDFNITDAWRISGGGRFSHTDIGITITNPQAGLTGKSDIHSVQNRWDWLISMDYKITDDILAYATAASGSRPPGLATIVLNDRQLVPTADENLISYELGVKADLFDRRLRTNLTAFYLDYKKLATGVFGTQCLGEPGTGPATWYNAPYNLQAGFDLCQAKYGDARTAQYSISVGIPAKVKGVEWEITAIPLDGVRIDWVGGYNNFTSGAATGQPGYLFPGNHRQPEWNMHANVSYDIETSLGRFTPRLDWNWQSQQDYDNSASTRAPLEVFIIHPYSLFNAQLAYETVDRSWTATLSVTNLGDKYVHYQALQGSINTQTRAGPPREFMFTVRKTF